MPRAQSADGVLHDFPEGTDPSVIDRTMKAYAQAHQPAPAMSFGEGVGTGLLDKFYGAAQLGGHIAAVPEQALVGDFGMVPEATRQTVDRTIQERERRIQAEGGGGAGRVVGNIIGDI